jgi:hypothetical protein
MKKETIFVNTVGSSQSNPTSPNGPNESELSSGHARTGATNSNQNSPTNNNRLIDDSNKVSILRILYFSAESLGT